MDDQKPATSKDRSRLLKISGLLALIALLGDVIGFMLLGQVGDHSSSDNAIMLLIIWMPLHYTLAFVAYVSATIFTIAFAVSVLHKKLTRSKQGLFLAVLLVLVVLFALKVRTLGLL